MSNTSIMSVQDMINTAFGDADKNTVNFKLVHSILYILARQLRLLQRRVEVEIDPFISPVSSSILITEVKLKANVPKRRRKLVKSDTGQNKRETKKTSPLEKTVLNQPKIDSVRSETDKSSEATISKSEKTSSKSTTDKTTTSSFKTSTTLTSSTTKTTTEKSTTDKSSTDKTSTQQSSMEKSSSDKTKSSTQQSSSDSHPKSSTEKSSSDRIKSSTEKSSSDKTKSSTDKSSSDRTKSSTEKSSSDRTKSSTEKSSSDRTKSSTDKSSSEKTKSSSDKTSTEDYRKKFSSKDYHHLLEDIEQQREQELRVVSQRADSREEAKKIPTPMASLDEMEVQYEKLLIVERVPTDTDTRERTGRSRDRNEQPLSVVTQTQFDGLAKMVNELKEKFGAVGKAELPENIQLMHELRRGASLTDAMAALQLSARVEATEKTLEQMMSLVTDIAVRKGIDIETMPGKKIDLETEVLFDAVGPSSQVPPKMSRKSAAFKQPRPPAQKTAKTSYDKIETYPLQPSSDTLQQIDTNYDNIQTAIEVEEIDTSGPKVKPSWITSEELDEAMELLYDSLFKMITNSTSKSISNADSALKIAARLERKIDEALNLDTRMEDLESLVSEYAAQINILDTGLSSYMTDYQEQLTQMQHDLEGGLEAMAEAMANTGGDTAAVAELNSNITNLQIEFDSTNLKQKKLKDQQNLLFTDLENLWKQIEILRETKSDREEAADALRDKAGLGALNGLVSQEQFDAVRGDYEKRIGAAYDKFNNQEIIWQKAIDDLLRELNEKADWMQVASLRNDVNDNLEKLRKRINAIMEIVGEPRSAAVAKRLFHDTACLSCASPAHMNLEETATIPALPSFPKAGTGPAAIGAEDKSKPKEDGDHLCYPGLPIPHPKDPRSYVCQRYCGGSHTIVSSALSRAPVGMIITPVVKRVTTEIGSDGRTYMTDEPALQNKPCLPCNFPKETTLKPVEAEDASTNKINSPSLNFLMSTESMTVKQEDCISVTPPPPLDE